MANGDDTGRSGPIPPPEVRPAGGPRPPQVTTPASDAPEDECLRCDHQWHGAFRPLAVWLFRKIREWLARRRG